MEAAHQGVAPGHRHDLGRRIHDLREFGVERRRELQLAPQAVAARRPAERPFGGDVDGIGLERVQQFRDALLRPDGEIDARAAGTRARRELVRLDLEAACQPAEPQHADHLQAEYDDQDAAHLHQQLTTLEQDETQYDADGNAILLTKRERFHDETAGYSEAAVQVLAQPGGKAWNVFGDRQLALAREFPDFVEAEKAGALRTAADPAGLAAIIGCMPEQLSPEIARFVSAA